MRRFTLLICLLMTWPASAARADRLKVNFVAIVDYVDDALCQCVPSSAITFDDTLVGSYIYDLDAADNDPSDYVGEYVHTTIPYGIEVHKGPYSFESDTNNVSFWVFVRDSSSSGVVHDALDLQSWGNSDDPFWGAGPLELISIRLEDNTETALDSDSLPTAAPVLADWADARVLTIWGDSFDYRIVSTLVSVESVPTAVTAGQMRRSALEQNYPNPFNPATTIRFKLARSEHVHLAIYDVKGVLVSVLIDGVRSAAPHATVWDGRDDRGNPVASGIYFYRLIAGDFQATKKMVLLR